MSADSRESLLWWDRDTDITGRPIRADVRTAARQIWDHACQQARALLGEPCEAAALMEKSVAQVSRYLDRRAVPLFQKATDGLLMCAFCRALRRQVSKHRRIELVSDIPDNSKACRHQNYANKEDCRLDAEKALRRLHERAQKMFKLRNAGYEWKEIGRMLGMSDDAARAEFSRELKRAKLTVQNQSFRRHD